MDLPPASLTSHSPGETMAQAAALAAHFPHALVLLTGSMGSGKTLWTNGFATRLGCREPVTSPTFSVMNVYAGTDGPVYHLDLYRIGCLEELMDIGLFELLELSPPPEGTTARLRRTPPCVVEWSERVPALAELPHLAVHLEIPPDGPLNDRILTWTEKRGF